MQGFSSAQKVFASSFTVGGVNVRSSIIYWIVIVAIGSWILLRTRIGNWIFSVGGSAPSARAVGVPVGKMKIGLFMGVGLLAWFTGMVTLFQFNTIQSGQGVGNEFVYIIAAVVGGCLFTGGYGSVVGAALGALIFGMVNQGIIYAGWDPDWFTFFLGALLLGVILLNNYIRRDRHRVPGPGRLPAHAGVAQLLPRQRGAEGPADGHPLHEKDVQGGDADHGHRPARRRPADRHPFRR